MSSEQIRTLVIGIVTLAVLVISAFVPALAEQLDFIKDNIVEIILIILGIPALGQAVHRYTDMRVQTAQIQASAAQSARNTGRE